MKTIICLMRHGQTNWNKEGRIQGVIDNKLNETGKLQAQEIGAYLKNNDPDWDIIISSPLSRAYETGFIVSKIIGYNKEIIINESVIERDFGKLEGAYLSNETYDVLFSEQVEGLEKQDDLIKRSYSTMLEIAKRYPGKKVLVATHSQFIKGVITKLDSTFNFKSVLKNTSLNYFTYDKELKVDKINITNE